MPYVRLPSPMRPAVGGRDSVAVTGDTLRQAIDDLVTAYPAVKDRLLGPGGQLHPYLMVVVDGVEAEGLWMPLKPESEIVIIPAVGGG